MADTYLNMRDIAAPFGKTSHEIGKVLKQRGLRDEFGKPTREALENGVAARRDFNGHPVYLWNQDNLTFVLKNYVGWALLSDKEERAA